MKRTIIAAALLLQAQAASAQDECIQRAQAGQMAVVLVPSLIDSAARSCAAHLPAGAYLGNGSGALADRLRAETAAVRDASVAGILALAGQVPAAGQDPEQLIRTLTDSFTAGLDPVKCRSASELAEALAPLSAASFGQAFGAIIAAAASDAGDDAPAICPA